MQNISRQNMRERIFLAKTIPLDTPFTIVIDIISLCNFKCNFCFHSLSDDEKKRLNFNPGIMDYELFKKVIDQIAEFPTKLKKLALYMRGEPLLHKKLPDMIAYAKERNVSEVVQVTTNGYFLSPVMNKKLIDAGLDELVVSVEALSADKYMEITGASIDYDRFVENIKDFFEHKDKCKIYVKIVDVGIVKGEEQKFNKIFEKICDKNFIEYILPQYKKVDYADIKQNFKKDVRGHEIRKVEVCAQPFLSLYVLHNGDVCVCCIDYSGKIVFGNIKDSSLVNIWRSKDLKKFRIMHLQKKRCLHLECGKCNYPDYNTPKQDILDEYTDEILLKFV